MAFLQRTSSAPHISTQARACTNRQQATAAHLGDESLDGVARHRSRFGAMREVGAGSGVACGHWRLLALYIAHHLQNRSKLLAKLMFWWILVLPVSARLILARAYRYDW